ncbi:MAG: hypothetical protein BWZ07_00581 [Alphaproteobacteria bacterium ADurb.BinA280]|jgi:hypothetical protein|nr:hypothetical protein [Aquimonas sp.]OPZ13383.1 MAG: hypothetical protein BWZ07_00581 [Alphaproteobacteria bacterium ADurb.BinA280]
MKLWKIILALAVLGALFKALTPGGSPQGVPVTAERVAAHAQKTLQFPVDLGDGFRLDSIRAEGDAIVSTVTLMNVPAGAVDPTLAAALQGASTSDTCREIAAQKQAYADAGLSVVKVYRNSAGGEISRAVIEPAQCP